jgi:hypothetical protein
VDQPAAAAASLDVEPARDYQHHPEHVQHLFVWEDTKVHTGSHEHMLTAGSQEGPRNLLDDNMLGGQNVRVRPIAEMFLPGIEGDPSPADTVLKPTPSNTFWFVVELLLPGVCLECLRHFDQMD